MIKLLIFTVFQFSLFGSFSQSKKSSYKIVGNLKGFGNGTKMYLNDLSDGSYRKMDSAIINNSSFTFVGMMKTNYLKASITNVDYSDRVMFWLEAGNTIFSGAKSDFQHAVIRGSKIQEKYTELTKLHGTLENTQSVDLRFISNNPSSIISAYTLYGYRNIWNKDTISSLYNILTNQVKKSYYGKNILAYLTLKRDIKIGDDFVDIEQVDTANKIIRLADFKGKVILIEFWGSWCGPCREENPSLMKIYNNYKSQGFEIFGVATETDRKQWIKAIEADSLTWINVTDFNGTNNKAAITYGVTGYPTNFLINKAGKIIARDVYGEQLSELLDKIL